VSKHLNPRQEALSAIEKFERDRCHGGLLKSDSLLLSRLRSDRYRFELEDAWKWIVQYRKFSEDEQLLITNIFNAYHFALEAPAILEEMNPVLDDFRRLRQCADELRAFFEGGKIRYTGEQTTAEVDRILQSLSWAIGVFDRGEREISTLPKRLRLNRKLTGSSADAQRMRFTSRMCEAMLAIFGRPLDSAVAALTNIALQIEISGDEVRAASRHTREAAKRAALSRP
jgi:hypothetical protein